MPVSVPDLCDDFIDQLTLLDPVFRDFGGRRRFSGPVSTVKCFEDNSRVKEALGEPGEGRVLVVDGGGSKRCALLGDMLAGMGVDNDWAGIVVFGCVRDVEITAGMDIGIRALAPYPVKSNKRSEGQRDIPIQLPGGLIEPGNHLYADENGVVVARAELGVDFHD